MLLITCGTYEICIYAILAYATYEHHYNLVVGESQEALLFDIKKNHPPSFFNVCDLVDNA